MGWSYTRQAGEAMDRIEAACKQTRAPHKDERSSNVFFQNGKRYFYEVTRRDQLDGGICGTINLMWENNEGEWARQVGTFRIDGQGKVVLGPALFRKAGPVASDRWS